MATFDEGQGSFPQIVLGPELAFACESSTASVSTSSWMMMTADALLIASTTGCILLQIYTDRPPLAALRQTERFQVLERCHRQPAVLSNADALIPSLAPSQPCSGTALADYNTGHTSW